MKFLIKIILYIVVIGALGFAGFNVYSHILAQKNTPLFTPIVISSSSTPSVISSTTPEQNGQHIAYPASSTLDISSWRTYSNLQQKFTLQYPSNLVQNGDATSTWFVFPKDTYFHWPLQDDAKVTITVASACPEILSGAFSATSSSFSMNGYLFTRSQGNDVGAGNLYTEIAYDTHVQGKCYHISLFDHGTNGAGFYVDDQSLISTYDAQHTTDMSIVIDVFNAVVKSFRIQ